MLALVIDSQDAVSPDLPPEIAESLLRFRDRVLESFPDQIRHVILYGSFARGEAHAESDVDVMVVVAGGGSLAYSDPRTEAISSLAFEATLECGRTISPLIISERRFEHGSLVASEARREGLDLLKARWIDHQLAASRWHEIAGVMHLKESAADYDADDSADLTDPRVWLQLAEHKLQAARVLATAGYYDDTISRAYYAMLYAARAALLSAGVIVKSHHGAVSEFARLFVTTRRVEPRYGEVFARSLRERLRSDYEPVKHATQDDADRILADAAAFLARMHELIAAK